MADRDAENDETAGRAERDGGEDPAGNGRALSIESRRLKQDRFLAAFLQNPTISDAARTASVHRDTIYEWLKDPEFAERFKRLKEQSSAESEAKLEEAQAIIQQAAPKAAETMVEMLGATRQDVRLKASESILNRTERLSGSQDQPSFGVLLQLLGRDEGD
jgi:transposase